jgi:membrane-associated protein
MIFTLAFLEACPGIGLFISGAFLLSLASVLYHQEVLSLSMISGVAIFGAFLSDQLGFYLGRGLGVGLVQADWMQAHDERLSRARAFIQRYGALAVIATMVRSIIPMTMGIAGFSRWKFLVLDVVACCIWGSGLAGLVLGLDSLLGRWF